MNPAQHALAAISLYQIWQISIQPGTAIAKERYSTSGTFTAWQREGNGEIGLARESARGRYITCFIDRQHISLNFRLNFAPPPEQGEPVLAASSNPLTQRSNEISTMASLALLLSRCNHCRSKRSGQSDNLQSPQSTATGLD